MQLADLERCEGAHSEISPKASTIQANHGKQKNLIELFEGL